MNEINIVSLIVLMVKFCRLWLNGVYLVIFGKIRAGALIRYKKMLSPTLTKSDAYFRFFFVNLSGWLLKSLKKLLLVLKMVL